MKTIKHIKTFKVRLLPTIEQEQLLWKSCNVNRAMYNLALDYTMKYYQETGKSLSAYSLRKEMLKITSTDEYSWLNDVSRRIIHFACFDVANAYTVFFRTQKKSKTKFSSKKIEHYKRIGKKLTLYDMIGHPKFKSKKYETPRFKNREDLYFRDDWVSIEKIGHVKVKTNYTLPKGKKGEYKFINPRVKYIHGKWMLMISIECENQAPELNQYNLGIDVGVKSTAVISFNNSTQSKVYKNINKSYKVRRLKKKLKHLQKLQCKCYQKNNNYNKTNKIKRLEQQIADINYKLANIRRNYNHHISKEIVNILPQKIVMEDLNIRGMMKNKHLAKSISEQCLYQLMEFIKYKAQMKDIEIVKVDRFYPSSKKCSCCGNIKKDLKLKDRTYKCPECGTIIDRDLNAAINLENYSNE